MDIAEGRLLEQTKVDFEAFVRFCNDLDLESYVLAHVLWHFRAIFAVEGLRGWIWVDFLMVADISWSSELTLVEGLKGWIWAEGVILIQLVNYETLRDYRNYFLIFLNKFTKVIKNMLDWSETFL